MWLKEVGEPTRMTDQGARLVLPAFVRNAGSLGIEPA